VETVALRCTNCGAPLPKPKPGEEWVRCEYCGFLNKVVDATAYVEKLRRDLEKWIREILPSTTISSTVADLAARHQIFQEIIKPKVMIARSNLRAKYLLYLSTPLTPIFPSSSSSDDPKPIFEETLKIQAVRDLAVSEDDLKLIQETIIYGNTAGYLLNAVKALSRSDVKSALKNIEEALADIPDEPGFNLVKQRFKAARSVLTALSLLYDRDTQAAIDIAKTGIDQYNTLLDSVGSPASPEVNRGVLEAEKMIAEIVYKISEASHEFFRAGKDPLEVLRFIEAYTKVFQLIRETYKRPLSDLVEIVENLRGIVLAKNGSPQVYVVSGSGNFYLPFYVVESRFSFVKGMFLKKGEESRLTMLVSAIAPYAANPVTDVFGVYSGKPVKLEKVEEAPLYPVLKNIISSIKASGLPTDARVTPPLISSMLAEKIFDSYMNIVSIKYGGKIIFVSSQATGIIYIPFNPVNQRTLAYERGLSINLITDLDNLAKLSV